MLHTHMLQIETYFACCIVLHNTLRWSFQLYNFSNDVFVRNVIEPDECDDYMPCTIVSQGSNALCIS